MWVVAGLAAPVAADDPVDGLGDPLPPGAVRRLGTVRFRHAEAVSDVAFARDGRYVVSAARGRLRVWEAATGRSVRSFAHADGGEHKFAVVGPDGKSVVGVVSRQAFDSEARVLRNDREFVYWDFETGEQLGAIPAPDERVFDLARSPEGALFASGGEDGTVLVTDFRTRERKWKLSMAGSVYDLDFFRDGRVLAAAGREGVAIWDLATGKRMASWRPAAAERTLASGVAYSPDGRHLAVAWDGGKLDVLSAEDGSVLRRLEARDGSTIAWSPDGTRLAFADRWGDLYVWETQEFGLLKRERRRRERLHRLAFAPDGKRLAAAGEHAVRVFTLPDLAPVVAVAGHACAIEALAVTRDGAMLASGPTDEPIHLWDPCTGELRDRLAFRGHGVTSLDFGPAGEMLAAGFHQTLRVWDVPAREVVVEAQGAEDQWQYVRVSPDGTHVAWSSGEMIRLVEIATGKPTRVLHHGGALTDNWHNGALAFTPGGAVLAFLDDGTARRWTDGKESVRLRRPAHARRPLFAPDGRTLALGGWEAAGFYSLDGSERHSALADETPEHWDGWLAFHPTGAYALSGTQEGDLQLWEVATARICATFTGGQGRCHATAFLPDGRHLATAGTDTTILIWDLASLGAAPPVRNATAARKLAPSLRGADARVAFASLGAFVRGGKASVRALEDTARRKSRAVAVRAVVALDMMGTDEALAALQRIAKRTSKADLERLALAAVARHEGLAK